MHLLPQVRNQHSGSSPEALKIVEYVRQFGRVFTSSLGRKPSLVVADPKVAPNGLKHFPVRIQSNPYQAATH